MKKKGFTLIELLAVIVILAIIALIATPIILSMINNARKSAAKSSAYGYIEAIDSNNGFADAEVEGYTKIINGTHQTSDITVRMKGKAPDGGTVTITNGKVSSANICINGYTVTYDGHEAEVGNKCEVIYEVFRPKSEQETYTVPASGKYKLEVWGAQGGNASYGGRNSTGGYGGYSVGIVTLNKGDKLYINVGTQGISTYTLSGQTNAGGYNGGAASRQDGWGIGASSGGATSIATSSGLLSELSDDKSSILIVAGAGGSGGVEYSGARRTANGGHAGGYIGSSGNNTGGIYVGSGGTQAESEGSVFGKGEDNGGWYGVPGAGFYGGTFGCGGGGGSSYIATKLTDKAMYCYECLENNDPDTKTIATTCVNDEPTANCAKTGDGFATITYINS